MLVKKIRNVSIVGKCYSVQIIIYFDLIYFQFFKFSNFRLHNKGVYVKMGLKKMVSRKSWQNFNKDIRLEVDGKHVVLDSKVEGIIILNILR